MKYNISNLEQIKGENIMESLTKEITENKYNLIEEQLEKLIKPYVDVKKFGLELSKCILNNKGLDIKCVDNGEYTRYSVIDKTTSEEDFFLVQNNTEIKEEDNKCMIETYISDIVRGIK